MAVINKFVYMAVGSCETGRSLIHPDYKLPVKYQARSYPVPVI